MFRYDRSRDLMEDVHAIWSESWNAQVGSSVWRKAQAEAKLRGQPKKMTGTEKVGLWGKPRMNPELPARQIGRAHV